MEEHKIKLPSIRDLYFHQNLEEVPEKIETMHDLL
jgi:hypothetical protein